MKSLRKFFAVILVVIFAFSCSVIQTSAAEVTNIVVPATYGQMEARKMLSLINNFRTGSDAWYWNSDNSQKVYVSGLGNLTYDYDLEQAAMVRAAEIAVSFAHTRPDGTSCFTAYDCKAAAGENIAIGYTTAASVFEGWQETNENYSGQGHRRNMLSQGVKAIGIGHAVINGVHCWVQEFRDNVVEPDATKANDSLTNVPINVLNSTITSSSVTASTKSVSLKNSGSSEALPTLNVTFMTSGTWSYIGNISGTVQGTWTSADTNIAKIESGKVVAVSAGTTTLKTQALGKTITVTCTVTGKSENIGDVNNDGKINSSDALSVLEHSVGKKTLADDAITRADTNKDNAVNSSDALLILQYSVGKINKF